MTDRDLSEQPLPGPLVAGPNPRRERSRRRMTPLRSAAYAVIAPLAVALLRLLWATYRFEVEEDERSAALVATGRPVILALWHDSLFACSWFMALLARRGVAVSYLVSPSADGELAVRLLRVMGWRAERGSATRSGVKALHGMFRAIRRDGSSPVIVPDGPRGPRRAAKLGAVLLGRLSGTPVIPLAAAASRVWALRTWDRLEAATEAARVELEQRLTAMSEVAASRLGSR